jgi:SAM-dependent methyltransferase
MPPDPTQRFSDRVANYVRYRPGYPAAVVEILAVEIGLAPTWVVADVGSGTGLSSEPFLKFGCTVYGVEPNAAMRQAAEKLMRGYPGFRSVAGSAEATALPDASVDLVAAGQAFHWFDAVKTRREFARVLRPGGWLALMWNRWNPDATPFLRAYEDVLLRFGTDYRQVNHRDIDPDKVRSVFDAASYRERQFPHAQEFDDAGLEGRLLSSSYVPAPGQPNHEPMVAELRRVFDAHQVGGRVRLDLRTDLYFGRINAAD